MSNIFENAIILSDFDGTFAYGTKTRQTAPQEDNLRAVECFKANGGHFTLSTGRLQTLLPVLMPGYREIVNAPMILANGGLLYDAQSGAELECHKMTREKAESLLAEIEEKFNSPHWYIYDEDGDLIDPPTPASRQRPFRYKMNFLFDDPERAIALRKWVNETHGDGFNAFRSFSGCCEVVDRAASKERLVRRVKELVAAKTGKKAENFRIYAAGDYENDIAILKSADMSFCPLNAVDEVKEIADRVLCHCTKGIIYPMLDYIEKNERMMKS